MRFISSASASSSAGNSSRRFVHPSSTTRGTTNNLSSFSSATSTGVRGGSVFSQSSDASVVSVSSLAGNNNNNNGQQQQEMDVSEAWIADFGSSTVVSDEQRRAVRAEIEDIESTIQQTKIGIHQEESTADQLNKDTSHADLEMSEMNTKSNDIIESSTMNKRCLVDLGNTLSADLMEPLSDKMNTNISGKINDGSSNHHDGTSGGGGGREGDNGGIETTKKFLQRSYQKADAVLRCDENKVLAKAKADCGILQQEVASIRQRIQSENLHPLLAQKKEEADARRRDMEAEVARKHTVEAAIQQSRMQCGGLAQAITDKRKTLMDMKKGHEAELAQLRQDLEASQAELQGVKSKEEWESELAAVEKQRDAALKTIVDAKAMIEKRKSLGMDCEAMQSSLQELRSTEQNMTTKVTALKERVNQAKTKLESAKKEEEQVETIKIENDHFEAEKVLPAKSELIDVLKEKEQLAQCINKAHEDLKTHTEKVAAARQEGEKELHRLEVQIKETQMQLTEKTTEMENLKSIKDKSDQAQTEETTKLQRYIDQVQTAANSEQDHADERARGAKSKLKEAKVAKEEAESKKLSCERYQAVLDLGVKVLDATATQVQAIQENIGTESDEDDSSVSSWD